MSARLNIAGRLGQMAMNSYVTPIASLLIFLAGLLALMVTPREENPQIDVPAANVIVAMPGASPEEVLNHVVRPLEMVLSEIPGVDHSYGMADESLGVVTIQFKVGENREESMVKLYDRVMHNLDRVPAGASQPLIKPIDVDDVPIVTITFSSADGSYDDVMLKQIAERVREQLTPLSGVAVADIIGGRNRTVTVHIDPARLASRGVSLDVLHNVLKTANIDLPIGTTVNDDLVKPIKLHGALSTAAEVGAIVIAVRDGRPIYLQDVADIEDGGGEVEKTHRIAFGPAATDAPAVSGEPEQLAVTLTLSKKRGTNAVNIAHSIRDKLASLKGDFIPDNVNVTITRDSGQQADDAVNYLIEHLGIAIVSVVVILLFFLGWREAAIVTMNIPLILFIVLAIGFVADQTINRITLFSLILALGLLVDDAIVVVENIHRHLEKGVTTLSDKARVIIEATNETGRPTIIATFAVILAFLPMAFVTGMMGPYMGPIPFNTPIAMLASLIIAYLLTPWVAQRWLPCRIETPTLEEEGGRQQDWLHRLYSRLAAPLIDRRRWQWVFWLVIAVMFAAVMWQPVWQFVRPAGINGPPTPGTVELKMLPKGNKNTFNITVDMPEGTPLEITDAVIRDIGDVLRRYPWVRDYETYTGMAGPIDFNGMLRGNNMKRGPHIGEIRVNLANKHRRSLKSEQVVLELRERLQPVYERWPTASIKLVEDPPGPPVRATILAEVYGPDYQQARELAGRVHSAFDQTWDLVDSDDSVGADQIEYRVTVDKEKAAASHIDTAQVATLLRDFVAGFDIGVIHARYAREPVAINVRIPRELRIAPRDMDRLFVTNSEGQQIPVSAIAHVEEVIAPKPIYTKDGQPVIYITAEPKTRSQVYPLLDLDQRLDGMKTASGRHLTTGGMRFVRTVPDATFAPKLLWDGEMRLTLDVFRDLGAAFIVGLILIYVLLVSYYGSFITPLVVMGAIPLTMIGIFPGHMITGQPFTATSMIGMIALAGIVVRNSLLLIDFILGRRAEGIPLREAVIEAGAVRARPILLTALAVIAGTAIMISDPVFGGLGVSMAFGTLASTLLTLFVIPLIYYQWQRRHEPSATTPDGNTR
jgi:multidrug efflux pump subunit AcrB